MNDNLELVTKNREWNDLVDALLMEDSFSTEFTERFHTFWTVSGHHVREQINDDARLIKLLRHVLPSYSSEGLTLYRGENSQRWSNNQVGLCWTISIDTARMFGRGLNSTPLGGLLMKCRCSANCIISGPSSHSRYLGEEEYTVDSALLSNIEILERYEPAY